MAWIIQITSGRGPAECCLLVAKISEAIEREASREGNELHLLHENAGSERGTFKSVSWIVMTEKIPLWLESWKGTIKWSARSPYRPEHKGSNWFAGVSVIPYEEPCEEILSNKELEIETMKASGAGGQKVNKVSSAVRITHLPTGLSAISQDSRSQAKNRMVAIERLRAKLARRSEASLDESKESQRTEHDDLERGNPVRVYQGVEFVRKI